MECNLKGPILTNINKAIGYGSEENIKSKFVMLNINDNLLNYTDYNEINNENIKFKNFTGLSGWSVGGIVIVFFVFLLLMSISFMILDSNKTSKKRKKKLLIVS